MFEISERVEPKKKKVSIKVKKQKKKETVKIFSKNWKNTKTEDESTEYLEEQIVYKENNKLEYC